MNVAPARINTQIGGIVRMLSVQPSELGNGYLEVES